MQCHESCCRPCARGLEGNASGTACAAEPCFIVCERIQTFTTGRQDETYDSFTWKHLHARSRSKDAMLLETDMRSVSTR